MGYKIRMVPEEYFVMELSDLEISYSDFVSEFSKSPSIHLLNPDDVETILEEIKMKMDCSNAGIEKPLFFMGVKIYESEQVVKGRIETY